MMQYAEQIGNSFHNDRGTIDSFYDGSKDTVRPNKKSIIPDFIRSLKIYGRAEFTEICMKDRRELTKSDLKRILNVVSKSRHKRLIITHGTYTMPDTARYLKANLKRNDQIVLLTGSFIPLKGFSPSDGPFNLGYAVAKLDNLHPGIYIAINGRVFRAEEALKIISRGRFSSIFG